MTSQKSDNTRPMWNKLLVCIPVTAGVLLIVQSGMTTCLGLVLGGDAIYPGAFSNVGGFGVMLFISGFFRAQHFKSAMKSSFADSRHDCLLFFMYFAGLLTSAYLIISSTAPRHLGMGVTFVCIVCGQVLCALVLDGTGVFWCPKHRIGWRKYIGVVAVVGGTGMFQLESAKTLEFDTMSILYIVFSVLCGALLLVAGAWNRKLAQYLAGPTYKVIGGQFRAGAFTFLLGTVILFTVAPCVNPNADFRAVQASDWWTFLGGLPGSFGISNNIISPGFIGFAATAGYTVLGQLCMSLLVDSVGMFGFDKVAVSALRILGLLVVLVGVAFVQWENYSRHKEAKALIEAKGTSSTCSEGPRLEGEGDAASPLSVSPPSPRSVAEDGDDEDLKDAGSILAATPRTDTTAYVDAFSEAHGGTRSQYTASPEEAFRIPRSGNVPRAFPSPNNVPRLNSGLGSRSMSWEPSPLLSPPSSPAEAAVPCRYTNYTPQFPPSWTPVPSHGFELALGE